MNTRTGLWLFALLALPSLLAAMSLAACTRTTPPDSATIDQLAYGNFRTAIASVPDRQFQVYWLGREFTAGGVVFRGPYFVPIGGVANAGQLDIEYAGQGGLRISLYSEAAWQRIGGDNRPLPKNAIGKTVTVNGVVGDLLQIPAGTRPVNSTRLTLHLGDAIIFVEAGAGGSATPGGPDANPLIDEQTFLSVLQNLRPYPQ